MKKFIFELDLGVKHSFLANSICENAVGERLENC